MWKPHLDVQKFFTFYDSDQLCVSPPIGGINHFRIIHNGILGLVSEIKNNLTHNESENLKKFSDLLQGGIRERVVIIFN